VALLNEPAVSFSKLSPLLKDRERDEDNAPLGALRGYDRRWDKARAAFLREPDNQFCRKCRDQGRLTVATVVDHIVPNRSDPALFWDRSNWQPICKPHHESASAAASLIDEGGWPVLPEPQ
jgi:5-methylcytosine-specific restriction enzyme A